MSTSKTLRELRKAIHELPLKELNRLKVEGIDGRPLHQALGFSTPLQLYSWLQNKEADSQTGDKLKDEENSSSNNDDDDDDSDDNEAEHSSSKGVKKSSLKRNKNAPVERSSKKQVSRNRAVIPTPKIDSRDPRFSHEDVNLALHRNRYEFLGENCESEIHELRSIVKRELLGRETTGKKGRKLRKLTDEELAEMRSNLTRLEQYRADTIRGKMYQEKLHELKQLDQNLVKKGVKRAFVIGAKDKKKLKLAVRYENLEKSGKLEHFMAKKRKQAKDEVRKSKKGPELGI